TDAARDDAQFSFLKDLSLIQFYFRGRLQLGFVGQGFLLNDDFFLNPNQANLTVFWEWTLCRWFGIIHSLKRKAGLCKGITDSRSGSAHRFFTICVSNGDHS